MYTPAIVSRTSYLIFLLGLCLELAVLGLLIRNKLVRIYSCFFVYVLSMVTRTLVLFAVLEKSRTIYRSLYWGTDVLGLALRFLVVWEIFRHTFPKESSIHKVVSKGFAMIAFGLLILAIGVFWSYENYAQFHSLYPALDRSFGFAQAVMILGMLLTARYYGIEFGRNLWGIGLSFGAWVSLSAANNAMIDLRHSFLPYWEFLRPLSFVAMLLVWVWAVSVYAPNPQPALETAAEPGQDLAEWEEGWDRTISSVRRVMHP